MERRLELIGGPMDGAEEVIPDSVKIPVRIHYQTQDNVWHTYRVDESTMSAVYEGLRDG